MAGKPAEQWYSGDWFRAVDIRKCTWATRGIWREMLDIMVNEQETGVITGTKAEICRVVGCTEVELDTFLEENGRHQFADVSVCYNGVTGARPNRENERQDAPEPGNPPEQAKPETNGNTIVTIINRRLHREFQARNATRGRVQAFRDRKKADGNANVTPPSSSSSSSSENREGVTYQDKGSDAAPNVTPPHDISAVEEFLGQHPEAKGKVNPEAFFHHYNSVGWADGQGRRFDWRAKVLQWAAEGQFVGKARDGPLEVHPCRGRNGERCPNPGVHRRQDNAGQTYWYCEKCQTEGVKRDNDSRQSQT